jgi:hypothetical protein
MPTTTAAGPLGGKVLPPIPNLHHVSSRNSPFKLVSISRGFFGSFDSVVFLSFVLTSGFCLVQDK